jgi:signal transduction histidine kinase
LTNAAQDKQALHAHCAALEQRAADSALQLEASERELNAFGVTLSHDLRAPLRSIEGFNRLLLRPPYTEQLDPTGLDYLQRIHRASLRLSQMMDELLQLVRLVRGGVQSERVDLSGMVRDILAGLQATAPARRIKALVEPDILVTGDSRLLRVALDNLLGNAWKFTRGNEVANIFFGRAMDEGVPAICVRDNGAGFDQKYADKLFRAFQRLHSAAEFEGSGMGLATAQRVMRAHGGRIWAHGQRGSGASFYFSLPGMAAARTDPEP